jgi:prevent-host-death family protein
MTIVKVGTRELKTRLSEYMQRVKKGETIIVTERGKSIGQIVPIQPTIDEKIQAVVDAGLADWVGKKFNPGKPSVINRSEKQLSDLVAEDRDVDYLP